MSVLEKDKVEARPVAAPPAKGTRRLGWIVWTLASLAIVAVAAAVSVVLLSGEEEATMQVDEGAESAGVAPADGSLFTEDELTLIRLVNQGYVDRQAVDWDTIELKRLVNRGLVPKSALQPADAVPEPLFTDSELLTIDLANRGLIPPEAVDWETVELKRLVNQGLIPREALP